MSLINNQPFSCKFSIGIPALLHQLRCTLVLSTYQAGRLLAFSALDEQRITQLPRSFKRPMGIALANDLMAIATANEVLIFSNAPKLAQKYPKNPDVYDTFYLPRATYYTGNMDIHDIVWGRDGNLYGVNTRLSCLVRINDYQYSTTPIWKPFFIDELRPEDRCHLNGVCTDNNGNLSWCRKFVALGGG